MNCIDARNGIDAIFILYEFNCLIAEENRVLPLVMAENLCSRIGNGGSPVWEDFTDNYNFTLGHGMFLILQTVCTNWERRLAVKIYGNLG